MGRSAGGQSDSTARQGRSYFRRLAPWDWRKRELPIKVRYRGGAEGWFEFHTRGGVFRCPGGLSIFDVMQVLASQDAAREPSKLFGDSINRD